MSDWETNLLKLAYNQYLQTGNLEFDVIANNGNEIVHNSNAIDALSDDEYIKVKSETALGYTFEITQKGIDYLRNLQ